MQRQPRTRQALGVRGGIEYPFRCEPVAWDNRPRKQLSPGSRLKDIVSLRVRSSIKTINGGRQPKSDGLNKKNKNHDWVIEILNSYTIDVSALTI